MRRRTFIELGAAAGVAAALPLEIAMAAPPSAAPKTIARKPKDPPKSKRITPTERKAAAKNAAKKGLTPGVSSPTIMANLATAIDPITKFPVPHYFGPFANYANSPLPRGPISKITVTSPGSGYTAPVVTITDAYGTGDNLATGTAIFATGGISDVVVNKGGAGYTINPIVTFTGAGGTGTGATATAVVQSGAVTSVFVDSAGSGYVAPVTVTIANASGVPPTMPADVTAIVVAGAIGSITVTAPGANYSAPVVTITDPTGTGATAVASVIPTPDPLTPTIPTGIRKFVDTLPGLTSLGQNNLGNYIPAAVPDTTSFPANATTGALAADYYEIAVVEFEHRFHTDLPPTRVRGYVQLATSVVPGLQVPLVNPDGTPILMPDGVTQALGVDKPRYLGPAIVASKGKPVRIKFYNLLPTGTGGDLFLPVDKTVMGAGMAMSVPMMMQEFKQNRATIHLHGAFVTWISDGTPHQWTTPAGEQTAYPQGVSVQNVPDMLDPGPGALTFYYSNEQSARLMFYHDHSWGITRLNVYAGEAAPYLITDTVEADLVSRGIIPGQMLPGQPTPLDEIPLVVQDKTFVDAATIMAQDPEWRFGTGASTQVPVTMPNGSTFTYPSRAPKTGDLWLPNVFVPAQNPDDPTGANPYGRWMYGPWFWPPTTNIDFGPTANPYAGMNAFEPTMVPQMPSPSMGMEAFNDTPIVNGTAYPTVTLDPKPYRFRILNAANDRFFNLHMYVADPMVTTIDGRIDTEVRMVPALKTAGFPAKWSADGRAGGVPDPRLKGPDWIQIGTEGGFLPEPVVIPPQPINWNGAATAFNFGNVTDHSLLLGCAERADVIVDFSQYGGKTLILYNDAPAAFPALDPRYDYYTGNPDQMDVGGAPSTIAGFGPNTRTVMQIKVNAGTSPGFNLTALQNEFKSTTGVPGAFVKAQDPIIVPQAVYNTAYGLTTGTAGAFPTTVAGQYVQIHDTKKTFNPIASVVSATSLTTLGAPATITFEEKAAHDEMGAAYDTSYGRMSGMFGLELLNTTNLTQNIILYGYVVPPVDILADSSFGTAAAVPIGALGDGTQIWKITHNGVDTHPVHFHLFNVQVLNRVAWDGAMLPPDPNELGWKETVRMNPLEDLIVAMRPVVPPNTPFEVPNSYRLLDPSMADGAVLTGPPGGYVDPALNVVTVTNHKINFGWEYVWHCHILSHEEMDMMHPQCLAVAPKAPSNLVATWLGGTKGLQLTWTDNSVNETQFTVKRRRSSQTTWTLIKVNAVAGAGSTATYLDTTFRTGQSDGWFYQVVASNIVGDTVTPGFPVVSADSAPLAIGAPLGTTVLDPIPPQTLRGAPIGLSFSYTPPAAPAVDNPAVDGITIQRATNAAFTRGLTTITLPAGSVAYSDTKINSRITYYYRVAAKNTPFGNGTWSAVRSVTTL